MIHVPEFYFTTETRSTRRKIQNRSWYIHIIAILFSVPSVSPW
jgi:hypothetical protein